MKQFLTFFFSIIFFIFELHATNIYIYDDLGSCEECVREVINTLKEHISDKYNIQRINHRGIIQADWILDTALLVIPGGRAGPYAQRLNGEGNRIIKSYVEQGGAFLGICAGAYYAGSFVEFAKNTTIEVVGARELALFAGTVVGPALASYDYYSDSGARAAALNLHELTVNEVTQECVLYYNGGGYFKNASNTSNTAVLASYSALKPEQAAIIECQVKDGVAILSGAHFEFPSYFLAPILGESYYSLVELEKQRKNLVKQIFVRLRLELVKS
jgi:biotin--protein ligase